MAIEHHYNPEDACKYGLIPAILMNHFQWWLIKNLADERHIHDGHVWTFTSIRALEKIYLYFTARQIWYAIQALLKAGVLIKGNFAARKNDRTLWYAFADESRFLMEDSILHTGKMALPPCEMHFTHRENAFYTQVKCLKETVTSPNPIPISQQQQLTGLVKYPQAVLDLDLKIAEAKTKFLQEVSVILSVHFRSEGKTFLAIANYLCQLAQKEPGKLRYLTDAIEWARQAKSANVENHKGLFVAMVKERAGFNATGNLLLNPRNRSHNVANI